MTNKPSPFFIVLQLHLDLFQVQTGKLKNIVKEVKTAEKVEKEVKVKDDLKGAHDFPDLDQTHEAQVLKVKVTETLAA